MIYLEETEDRERFAAGVLEAEMAPILPAVRRVLVKPNLVSHESYPTTTHPAVLRACLQFLLRAGKDVTVGDGPAADLQDAGRILKEHPLAEVCRSLGVPLVNLLDAPMITVASDRGDGFEIELSGLYREFDFILSLPVLKSHFVCKMTGALKNQFGFLSRRERAALHMKGKDIHRAIAEVNRAVRARLFIVDAVDTLIKTNELRHGGSKAHLGFMLGGADPVALDVLGLKLLERVDARLVGEHSAGVPYIRYAEEMGLGKAAARLQRP